MVSGTFLAVRSSRYAPFPNQSGVATCLPYARYSSDGAEPEMQNRLLSVSIGVLSAMVKAFIGLTWMKTFPWKLSCMVFPLAKAGNHCGTGLKNDNSQDNCFGAG